MQIDSSQFQKSLRAAKALPTLTLLVGEEDTLLCECLQQFQAEFTARHGSAVPDFNLEHLHGDRDDGDRIVESCSTLPLASDKKLVVLHHLEKSSQESWEKLGEYAANPNPSTCLLMLWNARPNQSALDRDLSSRAAESGMVVKCWRLYEERRPQWIRERMQKAEKQISAAGAELLSLEGGESLGELQSEIEKLLLYLGERKQAEVADVRESMSFKRNQSVWDLTENLEKKDVKAAGRVLEGCLNQGEEPIKMLNLIARSARRVAAGPGIDPKRARLLFDELKQSDLLLKSGHGRESAVFERVLQRFEAAMRPRR